MSYYKSDENAPKVQGTEAKKLTGFQLHQQKQAEKLRIAALEFGKRFHADIDLVEHKRANYNK